MCTTYQIGRDMQTLADRLQAVEDTLHALNTQEKGPCAPPLLEVAKITDQGEVMSASGQLLAYKTATFVGPKLADCEWKKESITLYSNGDYKDIYELKDHGTVFGDNFATQIKVQNAAEHTLSEWKWDVNVRAGAYWSDTVEGHDEAIARSFNEITQVSRYIVCSW